MGVQARSVTFVAGFRQSTTYFVPSVEVSIPA
jgi:hypothetical protein